MENNFDNNYQTQNFNSNTYNQYPQQAQDYNQGTYNQQNGYINQGNQSPQNNSYYNAPQYPQPPYNQQQFNQPPYNQPYPMYNYPQPKPKGKAIASFIMGLSGMLFSCCVWYVTFFVCVSALVLGIYSIKNNEGLKGLAIAGVILASVGIFMSIVAGLISVLMSLANSFVVY